ncbi:MAG: hypothetical protein K0S11_1476 [Gammaproteobacteria bacterium]|nr:hypothetical protein [Gammaproteobacteria bacterium]
MQLVEAIENNNDHAIKNLLDQEKNPYFVFEVSDNPIEQPIRYTLLTWAILKSESKTVKLILENTQLAFLINLMVDGMTPLARCLHDYAEDNSELLDHLLAAGADPGLLLCPNGDQELTTLQYLLNLAKPLDLKYKMLEKLVFTGLKISPSDYNYYIRSKAFPKVMEPLLKLGLVNACLARKQEYMTIINILDWIYVTDPKVFVAYVQHVVQNVHSISEHHNNKGYAYNSLSLTQRELLTNSILSVLLFKDRYLQKNLQQLFADMASYIFAQKPLAEEYLTLAACCALFAQDEHSKKILLSCCQQANNQHDALDTKLEDYYFTHKAQLLDFIANLQVKAMRLYLAAKQILGTPSIAWDTQQEDTSLEESDSGISFDFKEIWRRINEMQREQNKLRLEAERIAPFFERLQNNSLLTHFPEARSLAAFKLAFSLEADDFKEAALECFNLTSLKGQSPEIKNFYHNLFCEVKGEPLTRNKFSTHVTNDGISFWTKTKYDLQNQPSKSSIYWTHLTQPDNVKEAFSVAAKQATTSILKKGIFTKLSFDPDQIPQAEELVATLRNEC